MTPFAAVNPMPMSASPRAATLQAALEQRILVLDGAMGTMIQRHKLEEADYRGARFADWAHDLKGNNDLLVLTQPDIIRDIHRQYLEAGADLIETNTFNAQTISLADYHMESLAHEMNVAAARLAREAADAVGTPARPRFVAGAIGPTNRTASISPDVNDPGKRNVSYQQLVTAYLEQVRGLAEGGVDLFLIETIFDTLNAKAAIFACETFFEETGTRYPVILSGTITDASGRTLSGQTTAAFWASVRHAQPLAVGFNCALGGKDMRPYIAELAALADCGISCYPNAGLPNELGQYDEAPATTAGPDMLLTTNDSRQPSWLHSNLDWHRDAAAGAHRGEGRRPRLRRPRRRWHRRSLRRLWPRPWHLSRWPLRLHPPLRLPLPRRPYRPRHPRRPHRCPAARGDGSPLRSVG